MNQVLNPKFYTLDNFIFLRYGEIQGIKFHRDDWIATIYYPDIISTARAVTCTAHIRVYGQEIYPKFSDPSHYKQRYNIPLDLFGVTKVHLCNIFS